MLERVSLFPDRGVAERVCAAAVNADAVDDDIVRFDDAKRSVLLELAVCAVD